LNCNKDAFEVTEHIVIPESKHAVTLLTQGKIANCVRSRFIVLPAVDFNNQTSFAANKIADIADYRDLSSELVSVDLTIANPIPIRMVFSLRPRTALPLTRIAAKSDLSPQRAGRG
jgi:hypothetical protein